MTHKQIFWVPPEAVVHDFGEVYATQLRPGHRLADGRRVVDARCWRLGLKQTLVDLTLEKAGVIEERRWHGSTRVFLLP